MQEKKSKGLLRRILALTLVAILFYSSTVVYINTLATSIEIETNNGFDIDTIDNAEIHECDDECTHECTENCIEDCIKECDELEEAEEVEIEIWLPGDDIDENLEYLKQQLEDAFDAVTTAQENAVKTLANITAFKDIYAMVYLCESYDVKQSPSLEAETVVSVFSGQTVVISGIDFTDGEFWYQVSFYLLNDNVTAEQEITDADFTLFSGYIESSFLAYSDELLLNWEAEYLVAWLNAIIHYENSLFELEMYLSEPEVFEEIEDYFEDELEFLEEFDSFFVGAAFASFAFTDVGIMANSFNFSEDIEQFPESYRPALYALKNKYPNWTFVRMNTFHNWANSVNGQLNPAHRSLIWDTAIPTWRGAWYEGRWHIATRDAVEHIMDPRNNLTESWIFQFEQLTYNSSYHNLSSMSNILQGTFMSGTIPGDTRSYAQAFMTLGANNGISPYHLAGRVRQEQGTAGTSALISGTHPGFEGFFNYFNIGASGSTTAQVITNGLTRARNEGWNTRYKSLEGGSRFIGNNYIKRGQDTLYLQKFNVTPANNGAYHHQYMQNIQAPRSEAVTVFNSYRNALNNAFVFKIPVYAGMPETAVPVNPNVRVTSITINNHADSVMIGNSLTLSATVLPSDAANKKVIWSSSNESVATINRDTGVITPRTAGETTITVTTTDGSNLSRTTTVRVTDNIRTFTLNESSLTFNGIGSETQTIIATATSLGNVNLPITWRSSDTNVVTVSANGVVTPVGVGNAVITASVTINGTVHERTCAVNVVFVFVGDPINAEMPEILPLIDTIDFEQNYPASAITVSASVADNGTLSYQWFRNAQNTNTGGTVISGATSANFIPPVSEVGTVYYYVVVTNTIANNGDGGNKTASITSSVTAVTVADTIAPTGEINISGNIFTDFLSTITFGLFYRSSQTINITAQDVGSGVDKIEWLALNQEFDNASEARAIGGWQTYDNNSKPTLPADWKGAVYARISDKAGNVSVINSNGIVVYTDTINTDETIDYTKGTAEGASLMLALFGNTIAAVHNGAELVDSSNYKINISLDGTNGKITFNQAYLDSLPTNIPTVLTISYNPQGVIGAGEANAPSSTTLRINVSAAKQATLSITNMPVSVTYLDKFVVGTSGGSGSGAVTFSSSNTDAAIVNETTGEVTIVGIGTFAITAIKAADNIFESAAVSIANTAKQKSLTITGVTTIDREFVNGKTTVELIGGSLVGVAAIDANDSSKLGFSLGVGYMENANAGDGKKVTTNIILTGSLAHNYRLTQPSLTVNIAKAAFTSSDQPKLVQYTNLANQNFDFNTLLGSLNVDGKELVYSIGDISGSDIFKVDIEVIDDVLIFALKGGNIGDKATIPVTVSGFTNFHDVTVNVVVTLTDKIPTILTVTVPTTGLMYGSTIGDPTAIAEAGGDVFTFTYSGVLANGTIYAETTDKPTKPGTYTVTAILVSDTHAGIGLSQSFTIQKRNLSWSTGIVAGKIYDGETTADILTEPGLNGVINDDDISIILGTASFSKADAGSIPVVANGYSVEDSSDLWKYNLPSGLPPFANAVISPREITISGVTAVERPYDGTKSVELDGGELAGVLDIDVSRVGFTLGNGTMNTANVGENEVVTNILLTGLAGGNYHLIQPEGILVSIVKANQNAPDLKIFYAPVNRTSYTVRISETLGAEYSFDGIEFGSANTLTGKLPGDEITAYKRMAGTINSYVGEIASATLILPDFAPLPQETIPPTQSEGGSVTETPSPEPSPTPVSGQTQNTNSNTPSQSTTGGQVQVNDVADELDVEDVGEEAESAGKVNNKTDEVGIDNDAVEEPENDVVLESKEGIFTDDTRASEREMFQVPMITALIAHEHFMIIILVTLTAVSVVCGIAITVRMKKRN